MVTQVASQSIRGDLSVVKITNYLRSGSSSQAPSVRTDTHTRPVVRALNQTRVTTNTPGFHNPDRVGRLKPRAFNFTETVTNYETGYWTSYLTRLGVSTAANTYNNSVGCTGSFTGVGVPAGVDAGLDTAVITELTQLANGKLLRKIKSSSVNIAVAAAERNKTANMVANAATRIAKSIRNLRRGNFVQAAEDLGALASRRGRKRFSRAYARDVEQAVARGWLELQYGWKPLLNDVFGSAEALANRQLAPMHVTARVREKREQPWKWENQSKTGKLTSGNFGSGSRKTDVTVSVTYYRPANQSTSMSALGITNPALVAWEVVPFSFVADWFLPIGNFLETFDATSGLEFYSGYRTTFVRRNYNYTRYQRGVDSYSVSQDMSYTASKEYVSCVREVLTTFPTVTRPYFRNPFSVTRAASAIALISVLFRK